MSKASTMAGFVAGLVIGGAAAWYYAREMYSRIAEEEGSFTLDDVVNGICRKMIRRHPHVFGEAKASTPEEALGLWKEIKRRERAGEL